MSLLEKVKTKFKKTHSPLEETAKYLIIEKTERIDFGNLIDHYEVITIYYNYFEDAYNELQRLKNQYKDKHFFIYRRQIK